MLKSESHFLTTVNSQLMERQLPIQYRFKHCYTEHEWRVNPMGWDFYFHTRMRVCSEELLKAGFCSHRSVRKRTVLLSRNLTLVLHTLNWNELDTDIVNRFF
jgi:hypothetical protein